MKRQISQLFILFLLIGLCHAASAQTYPTKPIRLIVPFAPAEVARDGRGHLVTNATFETSVPGIHAIGAVRAGYSGLLRDAAAEAERVARAIASRLKE